MNKSIFFAAVFGLFAAVAFAGTVGSTCEDAVELPYNELIEGDTRACDATSIQCNTYKYSPKGMWYYFVGRGSGVVIDTCDQRTSLDSVIFVFSSCDKEGGYVNQCVTMDDDGCNQRQSRVRFTAEENVTYHVFVAGFLNSTGIFYINLDEELPPTNYKCENAMLAENLPFSTQGETGTCLNVFDACQFQPRAGLWYKVKGNGESFMAHTCNSNTNYDSFISVFSACSNNWTDCIARNNDACYRASMVQWRSVMNSWYYIFVNGFQNARGRFTLAIEKRGLNPYSYCYQPIVITAIPYYYSGQTDYLNTTFSECRNTDNVHAMYFRFQGMNRRIVVTTCTSSSTVNDSVIDVYDMCDADPASARYGSGHQCVASNDDYCGLGAQVVFFAGSDSYFIAVSAASPTLEGVSFSLAVMPYEETQNSQCWYAKDVDSFPDVFTGNTTSFDTCEQSCDGSKVERRGGWWRYSHQGDSKTITLSTCNRFNVLKARLEVYKDCNEMSCVVQASPNDHGCTTATFVAENGVTYNMFVTAEDPKDEGGYFHVDFYEEEFNEHGSCENAWFINRGQLPWRVQDNTMLSNASFSSCDNKTLKGVWVAVIGTGTKLVATTCDSHTGFDTVLELYNHCPTGTEPGEERYCLKVNDDNPSCGRSSEIEWASTPGAYYWIYVTGFAGSSGIFVLNVYEKASMINAQCNTAVGIRNLPYYDYGLTTYSDLANASCKRNPRKGNWYELIGNDHWITLSTCNEETDFATEIEVYLACSDKGGEICVNHNHDTHCAPKTEITFAAMKGELFYIFVTGVDDAVMSEGFFGLTVTQGERLPKTTGSSSETGGISGFGGFMIAVGVFMGVGVLCACGAIGYGIYKRRHLSYQEISTSG